MKKLAGFFYQVSSGWVAVIGVIAFLAFSALTLPAQNASVESYSHGMGSPDTSFFYDRNTLLQMAEVYDEEGRSAYVQARWTFDLIFPFVYTFFLLTSSSFLLMKTIKVESAWRMLNLLPLAGMLLDFGENISASVVMAGYPTVHPWALFLAPLFTPLKWIFITFCMILLLISLLLWIYQMIFSGKKKANLHI